ncbi:protein phosphatase 1 regulatory subunit 37 [Oncorhynchus mykiss]|uniref:Protein phosphatase 1 regulatory subunit 37 n=1 Tax=Oncorhynchus mykiss TaxID=8022 RepID=A0A8C7RAG4_ONCMY|nr:protein phosphatase 1 regulatory subunit 37 [Oncorhynchus mykiss]XP_036821456.1 protein phosphatase 1 regulatory subunit 37 [Oncorhynchus mykiss]XP_036821457.1 protein phosphatase 1 regulatory subunit 37 [Oncorhynchus mykiss]
MNVEEQALDLCNVKRKNNVGDNTTNNSEEIIPRLSELMDGDLCKQGIGNEAANTSSLAKLTDNPRREDNHRSKETLEIDEVNGNKNNSVPDTSAIVSSDFHVYHDDQRQDESIKDTTPLSLMFAIEEGDDGGDMDIGVDLSLDESGMLESEPTDQGPSLAEEASSSSTNPDSSTPDAVTDKEPEKPSEQEDSPPVTAPGEVISPALDEGDDKHKNGKRVTFPSDEDIVSGAVEPKDPWRHAQNVTVDEILSAYRQACVKLNCKPIPKVLKQMQELKDLTHRNECLDLKGEKLDYKACESLEEVFKRVQFKVVDLEQTNLDEDGASALFDMIEYYESATHLNISFNKHIGTRGWQAAAHMMRKTSSLQYLDARNTPLLDHSAPFVARALRISGSLAVLHLENAGLSGRPLMLLATALKMNMNLRELYLADNKLNGLQDSAQLGNLLKFNCNIQILDLRNNHILDSGLAYVCEGLKEQRKGLVTLVLWNNQLTHNGMGYLAAALPCTQSLETLNLGHNSVGNEGVHKLKDSLIANRSVLRLGLASTKLSCEGAVAVAEFIAESPRLLRLDLRENEIKTGGLMALSLALKVNTSLLRLDLDREPKKETVKSFIDTQRSLLAEIQNGCKRNFILAKEKEETEQQMHSASMAEIATEDRTIEEDGADSGELVDNDGKDSECEGGEEGVKDTERLTESQLAASSEGVVLPLLLESDSDTDEEEDEEVVLSKAPSVSPAPKHTGPSLRAATTQHPLNASQTPPVPSASPATGSIISGITVTESTGAPGTPPSPGRCISVSSPGRGHKIFMVTRVESPSDQQQFQVLGKIGLTKPQVSKESVVSLVKETTQQPHPGSQPPQEEVRTQPQATPTPLTQELVQSSDDPQTVNPKPMEQSPVAPEQPPSEETVVETPNNPSETLELPSNLLTQPAEEEVEDVLDSSQPVLAEQSSLTAAQTSHSPSLPTEIAAATLASPQQTEQMVETTTEPRLEQSAVEQQSTEAALEGEEGEEVVVEKEESQDPVEETLCEQAESQTDTEEEDDMQSERLPQQDQSPEQARDTVQQPLAPQPLAPQLATQTNTKPLGSLLLTAPLQSQPETVQPDSELLPPQQEPAETLPRAQQQVAPESPPEQGATESVAEAETEQELYLWEEQQQLAQQALPVQVELQQQHPVLEELQKQQLQPEGQSQTTLPAEPSPVPAETDTSLEVEGRSSPQKGEESPDESSTDEGESVEEVVGSALPNGLKPEFALHLLDPEGPKPGPGSCVMEHVSVTAELSCGQDLEELLLEASLETGRDAP